jgi:hypothetical protein
MVTTGMNELAMRLGGFRFGHGGGDAFFLLLMGLVAMGALVWALSSAGGNRPAGN